MGERYIVIRSKKEQSKMNPEILQSLKSEFHSDKKIPIIYQRLHNPNEPLVIDSDNKIGQISNTRQSSNGDIIGDIQIFNVLKLANNFEGTIDNIAASLNLDTGKVNLDAFIIYDKVAKDELRLRKATKGFDLAKEGEIPLESNIKQEDLVAINDKLMEEYRKLVESQQDGN